MNARTPERLNALLQCESLALFVDRAQRAWPDFQLTGSNSGAVAELCRRLDGIPLALEMAAARAKRFPPARMLTMLERRFDLLVRRQRDLPSRHQTLREAIDWSYRLLSPRLRAFFARLFVFRGGFTAEAAATVCEARDRASVFLARLQDHSLVVAEAGEARLGREADSAGGRAPAGEERRFRLLETLREYAAEQLSLEERAEVARSHASFYLALTLAAEPEIASGPGQKLWLDRLETERDNLRAALDWAQESGAGCATDEGAGSEGPGPGEVGLRLAVSVYRSLRIRGYLAEGRDRLIALVRLPEAGGPTALRAAALGVAGRLAGHQGEYGAARALSEEGVAMWRCLADRRGLAVALRDLGVVAAEQGDLPAACRVLEESLLIFEALEDQRDIAATLNSLQMQHSRRSGSAAWLILGLLFLAPSAGRAGALSGYSVQVLAQVEQTTGGFTPHGFLFLSQLNDHGQLVLLTNDSNGGLLLGQWSEGKFIPIADDGGPAPGGKMWPQGLGVVTPISMNQAGSIAFQSTDSSGGRLGVYLWQSSKQAVIPVAEAGMPAVNNLVFANGGDTLGAWVNNHDEVAFIGYVQDASGNGQTGVFVRRADGTLQAVALPGAPLPGQAKSVADPADASINDAGLIAFDDVGSANVPQSGFMWENGTITSTASTGTKVPGFGTLLNSFNDGVNNKNRNVLIVSAMQEGQNARGLFFARDGQLFPIVLPGQALPGGGTYLGGRRDWCPPNELGQYPFVTQIEENGVTTTAAYVVQTDGTLSLIAKSGMTTNLGTLTRIGARLGAPGSGGIGINSQGQVALTAKIDNGPDTLLLLTPKTP